MGKSETKLENEYLTFEAIESGTFSFTNAVEYSINKGEWISLAANTATPTLNEGDTIRWKATISPTSSAGVGTFSSTCNYNAMGNPLSLNLGDAFIGVTTMPNKTYMFYHLFYNDTHIVNALNLALVCTTLRNSCYREMFKGCTALIVVPELPATSLADNCYRSMFSGCVSLERTCRFPATSVGQYSCAYMFENCTALTIVSDLIATTLDTFSYNNMFYGCTSLVIAPKIYATNLANFCCGGMFYGCTKLTEVDELPALTLATHCYEQMFYGCTSLVMGPELPATNLAANCYDNMFQGCINLRFAPELPATTLENYCYSSMFRNCTSLYAAPYLPAQTPVNYAYNQMFQGCSNLNYIKCDLVNPDTNYDSTYVTRNWVNNVAAEGLFIKINSSSNWSTGNNGVPSNWTNKTSVIDYEDFTGDTTLSPQGYLTFTATGDAAIALVSKGSSHTIYISKNGTSWKTLTTSDCFAFSNGESYYVCGSLTANQSNSSYTQFRLGGMMSVNGNCNSLWNYSNLTAALRSQCGYRLFYRCYGLLSAPSLPASTLTNTCYREMFQDCRALAEAPTLPATTLAPNCYRSMFNGCTSLTEAPVLPVETLQSYCYYYMFANCTKLTRAPELPAEYLVSNCYCYMFQNCSKLNYIKALFLDTPSNTYTNSWVSGVASSGTFVKNINAIWTNRGTNAVPTNWTIATVGSVEITYEASSKLPESWINDFDGRIGFTGFQDANGNEVWDEHTFENGVGTITFSGALTQILWNAFAGCTMTYIELPNTVATLDSKTFYGCTNLTSAVIGEGITLIKDSVFYGCNSLTSVTIYATTPPTLQDNWSDKDIWAEKIFPSNCTIYVPSSSLSTYRNASGWLTYASQIQAM